MKRAGKLFYAGMSYSLASKAIEKSLWKMNLLLSGGSVWDLSPLSSMRE